MNKAQPNIRLVVMDVDGTLTDGRIQLSTTGAEVKSFHARDGAGIKFLASVGIKAAIMSGRASDATSKRAEELGLDVVFQGVSDKAAQLQALCASLDLTPAAAAFIGDDLGDIPPMRLAGYSAAPADAAKETREAATYVCTRPGGEGAVREAIEDLLKRQGLWARVLEMHSASAKDSASTEGSASAKDSASTKQGAGPVSA